MSKTVAKFRLDAVETTLQSRQIDPSKGWGQDNMEQVEMKTMKMAPVYPNGNTDHENSKFWAASPSGSIHLGVVSPEAAKNFELGKEYYVTFEKA